MKDKKYFQGIFVKIKVGEKNSKINKQNEFCGSQ